MCLNIKGNSDSLYFTHSRKGQMDMIYRREDGTFETTDGLIKDIIPAAIAAAANFNETVSFELNGAIIVVEGDSNAEMIYRDWSRARAGYIEKAGPYPNEILSDIELANDARIASANRGSFDEMMFQRQARSAAEKEHFKMEMAGAPEMEFADFAGWSAWKARNDNNRGRAVADFAERWARLIQKKMATGENIEDVACDTFNTIYAVEQISGQMGFCAHYLLEWFWKYREDFIPWSSTIIPREAKAA